MIVVNIPNKAQDRIPQRYSLREMREVRHFLIVNVVFVNNAQPIQRVLYVMYFLYHQLAASVQVQMFFIRFVQVLAAVGNSGNTFNLAVNFGNFISLVGNMGAL